MLARTAAKRGVLLAVLRSPAGLLRDRCVVRGDTVLVCTRLAKLHVISAGARLLLFAATRSSLVPTKESVALVECAPGSQLAPPFTLSYGTRRRSAEARAFLGPVATPTARLPLLAHANRRSPRFKTPLGVRGSPGPQRAPRGTASAPRAQPYLPHNTNHPTKTRITQRPNYA